MKTGSTNTLGLNYGSTSKADLPVKFAGIENLWGNSYTWIDGVSTDNNRGCVININGIDNSCSTPAINNGYPADVVGTSEIGFWPITKNPDRADG